jgi:hypothetical protein
MFLLHDACNQRSQMPPRMPSAWKVWQAILVNLQSSIFLTGSSRSGSMNHWSHDCRTSSKTTMPMGQSLRSSFRMQTMQGQRKFISYGVLRSSCPTFLVREASKVAVADVVQCGRAALAIELGNSRDWSNPTSRSAAEAMGRLALWPPQHRQQRRLHEHPQPDRMHKRTETTRDLFEVTVILQRGCFACRKFQQRSAVQGTDCGCSCGNHVIDTRDVGRSHSTTMCS